MQRTATRHSRSILIDLLNSKIAKLHRAHHCKIGKRQIHIYIKWLSSFFFLQKIAITIGNASNNAQLHERNILEKCQINLYEYNKLRIYCCPFKLLKWKCLPYLMKTERNTSAINGRIIYNGGWRILQWWSERGSWCSTYRVPLVSDP